MMIDTSLLYEMGYNKGFTDGIKGSILKDDYENRLKAEKVAMLEDLKLDIEAKMNYYKQASKEPANYIYEVDMYGRMLGCSRAKQIIQQKIDKLKGNEDGKID